MNFGFLPFIIAIPVTLLIGYFQGIKSINFQKYFLDVPFHKVSIGVIILLTILELSIEPIYCVYQYELEFGRRSKFEGIALATKCITTFGAIYLTRQYFDGINFSGAAILSLWSVNSPTRQRCSSRMACPFLNSMREKALILGMVLSATKRSPNLTLLFYLY